MKKFILAEKTFKDYLIALNPSKLDNIKHCLVGILVGILSPYEVIPCLMSVYTILYNSLFIGKEIYDTQKENPTGFSFSDLTYNYVGLIIGMIISSYLHLIK